jgi:hypothetical protein
MTSSHKPRNLTHSSGSSLHSSSALSHMSRALSHMSRASSHMLCASPNEGWVANLDSITEKTVGGNFCRRASQFSATSIPNTMVLRHRLMTVSLIYSFGLRFGRSRLQRSTGSGMKVGGPQRSESATEPSRDRSPLRPRHPDRGGRR